MMDGKTALALAFAFVIIAGCVEPPQTLGCCLKTWKIGNVEHDISEGCRLYNVSDLQEYDFTAKTNGKCDKTNDTPSEVDTTGGCNVTVGTHTFLIPICTQNDMVPCISGNCTAMVCGDFVFKPRVAPGFSNLATDETPDSSQTKSAVSGAVPNETGGAAAMQFYKTQCRFLPMDAKLRGIMKNSKSQINVFRMGVGGSFDEFDQYRYYFPISDRYCNLNQPQPGQTLVDRYMNYLTKSSGVATAYDPNNAATGINSNCINGASNPPILAFGETSAQRSATASIAGATWSFSYKPVVPELRNYKFADYARFDNASNPQTSGSTVTMFRSIYLEPWVYTSYPYIYPKPCAYSVVGTTSSSYGSTYISGFTCINNMTGAACPQSGCINPSAPCFHGLAGTSTAPFGYNCTDPAGKSCAYTGGRPTSCPTGSACCVNLSAPCAYGFTSNTPGSGYLCINASGKTCTGNGCIDPKLPCAFSSATKLCMDGTSASAKECTGTACISSTSSCAINNTGSSHIYSGDYYICMTGTSSSALDCNGVGGCQDTGTPCAKNSTTYACVDKDGKYCPASGCIDTSNNGKCSYSTATTLCIKDSDKSVCPTSGTCTGHKSTGHKARGYKSTGYLAVGYKSTGHQTTGYALSQCIKAFADCTDSDTARTCTRQWMGTYLNTTCDASSGRTSSYSGSCNQQLYNCRDELAGQGWQNYQYYCQGNTLFGQSGSNSEYCYGSTCACNPSFQKTTYYYKYDRPYPVNVFKKIDDGYYRRQLSIAHVASIYNLAGTGSTRAPFECDVSGNDCYSGSCSTQTYNRGVMLRYTAGDNPMAAPEVVTDCSEYTDSAGIKEVVCAPTKSITAGSGGVAPTRSYGTVTVSPVLVGIYTNDYNSHPTVDKPFGAADLIDEDKLDKEWKDYWNNAYPRGSPSFTYMSTTTSSVTNVPEVSWTGPTSKVQKQNCPDVAQVQRFTSGTTWAPNTYSGTAATGLVWCPTVTESTTGPPAGGIVFFGNTGMGGDDEVVYNGHTIIGYTLLDENDFKQTLLYRNCNLGSSDYETVTLSDPSDVKITDATTGLRKKFEPYFQQRVKGLGQKLGTLKVSANSVVYAFTPWVVTFEKGTARYGSHVNKPGQVADKSKGNDGTYGYTYLGDFLTSLPSQSVRLRNTYDEAMDQMPGTSAGELNPAGDPWSGEEYTNSDEGKDVYHAYSLGFSRSITLIRYNPTTPGRLGNCAIDDNTRLPRMRTFGWCEPCTTSSLAFQNITAGEVYLPRYTAKLNETATANTYVAVNVQPICASATNTATLPYTDNATCFNAYITDMGDYTGSPAMQGSLRTAPEASIIKERLGNYMKSGVMPVLDISDASNWDLTHNVKVGTSTTFTTVQNYTEYPFQRLFGKMGAAVVIVDHIGSAAELGTYMTKSTCTAIPVTAYAQQVADLQSAWGISACPNTAMPGCTTPNIKVCNHVPCGCSGSPCGASYNLQALHSLYPQYSISECSTTGCGLVTLKDCNYNAGGKLDRIIKRTGAIRDKCADCLTAVHVDTPLSTYCNADTVGAASNCFNSTVKALLRDPRANLGVDLITFDYPVTLHHPPATITGLDNQSNAVAEDIAAYGRTALQAGRQPGAGKPTMVVGFNVDNGDSIWNAGGANKYDRLLNAIVENQMDLVGAGVIGVIYSPARSGAHALIDNTSGVGLKTDKFCDMEGAMERMSTSAPVAIMRRILAQDVACIPCSSLDYATGVCNLASATTQLRCDDGKTCTVPAGKIAGEVKCPSDSVTTGCTLCNATSNAGKTYTCTYRYSNGTSETVTGSLTDITSDLYSDIMAGLPKPDKCCIGNSEGAAGYSYAKQSYQSPLNKPLVFPKSGDPGMDCGLGGSSAKDVEQISSFCGYSIPLKEYDINCTVS